MQDIFYEFLDSERISVIAIEMPGGAPHAATVHFAYQKDPLAFIFLTDRTYRKAEAMRDGATARAALVIGTSEESMRTLQLNGTAAFTEEAGHKQVYFDKFPEKKENYSKPNDVFFVFTPTWWRYSDYKAPEGKRVTTSS